MKKNILWFTLVELIVVITIVWILSTVGFVSYSGYLTWARDSNRFSQLTKLSDSLQTYAAARTLPLPDDYIEITASGSENVIAYQWYVWVDVLETIDYTNGGRDPKDDSFFTYYLTKDRNSLQLLTFMEDAASVSFNNNTRSYAVDYEERFPKVYGQKLWVLISAEDGSLNTPVQELSSIISGSWYLDLVNTSESYTAIFSNNSSSQYVSQLETISREGKYFDSTLVWLDMETTVWNTLVDVSWNNNNAQRVWNSVIPWNTWWVLGASTDYGVPWWFMIPVFPEIMTDNLTVSVWSKTPNIWPLYNSLVNQWDCTWWPCNPTDKQAWWFGLFETSNSTL